MFPSHHCRNRLCMAPMAHADLHRYCASCRYVMKWWFRYGLALGGIIVAVMVRAWKLIELVK
jgi:hypothetical protein